MAIAQEPMFSEGAKSLKDGFEKAKRIAAEHEEGICYLDPNGLGIPTFIVFGDDTFDEWVKSPKRLFDHDDRNLVDMGDVLKELLSEKINESTNV